VVEMRFDKIFEKARDDKITRDGALYVDVEPGIAEKYRGE
jgi:hypothetical protein